LPPAAVKASLPDGLPERLRDVFASARGGPGRLPPRRYPEAKILVEAAGEQVDPGE